MPGAPGYARNLSNCEKKLKKVWKLSTTKKIQLVWQFSNENQIWAVTLPLKFPVYGHQSQQDTQTESFWWNICSESIYRLRNSL